VLVWRYGISVDVWCWYGSMVLVWTYGVGMDVWCWCCGMVLVLRYGVSMGRPPCYQHPH
jgi:hypothetical protein